MISSLDREARFSIIGFNYESSPWRTRLVKASPYNVEEARGFISRLSAGGGTNMHAALIDAVEVISKKNFKKIQPNPFVKPFYFSFVTLSVIHQMFHV